MGVENDTPMRVHNKSDEIIKLDVLNELKWGAYVQIRLLEDRTIVDPYR